MKKGVLSADDIAEAAFDEYKLDVYHDLLRDFAEGNVYVEVLPHPTLDLLEEVAAWLESEHGLKTVIQLDRMVDDGRPWCRMRVFVHAPIKTFI